MVTALSFFQPFQVFRKLGLRIEGRAVDALEHGAFLVATPVGSGHAEQLHRRNIRRSMDVGTLA